MEFGHSKVIQQDTSKGDTETIDNIGFELYNITPNIYIPFDILRQLAKIRLELLKAISIVTNDSTKNDDDGIQKYVNIYERQLTNIIKSNDIYNGKNLILGNDKVKWNKIMADQISHYILRLAFSKTEELSLWFVAIESHLFKYRYNKEAPMIIKQYIENCNLNLQKVDPQELCRVQTLLPMTYKNDVSIMDTFYKVDFTQVLNLVRYRMVYIEKGKAYIPSSEMGEIFVTEFRRLLSNSLKRIESFYGRIIEDERILLLLDAIIDSYNTDEYIPASYMNTTNKLSTSADIVTFTNIDKMSMESFPPCMQNLHHNLRKHHHLRHFGRLQYGLFLKGAGMSMDDQIKLWKQEFSHTMNTEKFEKNYIYNIRYNYGQEGRRSNFAPYDCLRIIKTNAPGVGDYHGCPFKHYDHETLMKQLQMLKISQADIENMEELVNSKHYHIACSRYFEVMHNMPKNTITIRNPNEYFDLSRNCYQEKSNILPTDSNNL